LAGQALGPGQTRIERLEGARAEGAIAHGAIQDSVELPAPEALLGRPGPPVGLGGVAIDPGLVVAGLALGGGQRGHGGHASCPVRVGCF